MLGNRNASNCFRMKLSVEKPDEALGIEDVFGDCCSLVVYNSKFYDYTKEYFTSSLNVLYLGDDAMKFEKSYNDNSGFCLLFSPKKLDYNVLQQLSAFVEYGYYDIDFEVEAQLRNYFKRICSEVVSDRLNPKQVAASLLFELSDYIIRNIILPKYYNSISN